MTADTVLLLNICVIIIIIIIIIRRIAIAMSPTATYVTVAWCICLSVTLVHPAKAVGRNKMPFGRDTRLVPSNIVLDGGSDPPREGNWGDLGI